MQEMTYMRILPPLHPVVHPLADVQDVVPRRLARRLCLEVLAARMAYAQERSRQRQRIRLRGDHDVRERTGRVWTRARLRVRDLQQG